MKTQGNEINIQRSSPDRSVAIRAMQMIGYRILGTAAIAFVFAILALPAFGQTNKNGAVHSIVGAWVETVTFDSGGDSFKSLVSFHGDGTISVSDQGAVTPGTIFSPGHGNWKVNRPSVFDWKVVELMTDGNGGLIGNLEVTGRYTVSNDGNSYAGTFAATIRDPAGNILFTGTGTNTGVRISVD